MMYENIVPLLEKRVTSSTRLSFASLTAVIGDFGDCGDISYLSNRINRFITHKKIIEIGCFYFDIVSMRSREEKEDVKAREALSSNRRGSNDYDSQPIGGDGRIRDFNGVVTRQARGGSHQVRRFAENSREISAVDNATNPSLGLIAESQTHQTTSRANTDPNSSVQNNSISSGDVYQVTAQLIDDDTVQEERSEELNQQTTNTAGVSGTIVVAAQVSNEDSSNPSSVKKWCIIIVMLAFIAIGGGIAAYFLTKDSSDNLEDDYSTVFLTRTPTLNPTSSPTIELKGVHKPPSEEDCEALSRGDFVFPWETETVSYEVQLDMALIYDTIEEYVWLAELEAIMQERIVPALAGCSTRSRRVRGLSKALTLRRLLIPYLVADATFDLTASGTCNEPPILCCKTVIAIFTVEIKEPEDDFKTMFEIFSTALEELEGAFENSAIFDSATVKAVRSAT
jgi:hypothetical protein